MLYALALFNIGMQEALLVSCAALIVFGRRLPQVAGDAARTFGRVRNTLQQMWRETGLEAELRAVKRDVEQAAPYDLSLSRPTPVVGSERSEPLGLARPSAPASGASPPPPSHPPDPAPDPAPDTGTPQS